MNELTVLSDNVALTISITEQIIEQYINSLDVKPRSKDTYRKGIKHMGVWTAYRLKKGLWRH